jgi:Na+-transporting methylmalonyl-CoA/oxaloacetate decarboxylase gamma subunit
MYSHMSLIPHFLANADGAGSAGSIMIVGFLLVVVVLALLAAITSAIGAFFARQAAREAARAADVSRQAAEGKASAPAAAPAAAIAASAPAAAAAPAAVAAEPNPEDDPVLLSVIAAAIHSIAGDRAHRIVSIRSSAEGWAQEGRRQIFSSHRIR